MAEGAGLFPPGWLRTTGGEPADDLELAVLLVNSHDELADPPDRLATLDWYAAVLRAVGHPEHANALGPGDLGVLRALRGGLRAAFTAATPEAAALALNPLLLTAAAVPVLVPGPDSHVQLRVAPGATGLPGPRRPAAHGAGRPHRPPRPDPPWFVCRSPLRLRLRRPDQSRQPALLLRPVQRPRRGRRLPQPPPPSPQGAARCGQTPGRRHMTAKQRPRWPEGVHKFLLTRRIGAEASDHGRVGAVRKP